MNTNPWLLHRKTMFATRAARERDEHFFTPVVVPAPARTFRVAHVLRKFNPEEWGGTETAVQRLFDGLTEHDVHSVMFCPRLDRPVTHEPLARNGTVVKRFTACVPIIGISRENKRQMVSVGGNLMSFDLPLLLLRQPDLTVIHTHALGRIGAIAGTIAQARKIPFVVTIHGGLLDLPPAMKYSFNKPDYGGFEWGKIFGLFLQSRRLLERADAVLTCNPNEARLLREKFPDKRIQVQPHGIPVDLYRQDCRAEARVAFPAIRDRQVLLTVGRIDPVKNQCWLVDQAHEICRRHPRVLLVFVGSITDEAYGEEFKRKIESHGLHDKILFTGGLPPGDPRLIGLLQESKAFVLPSHSETFGIVLLEAWAAGTAVISSRTSGAMSLVKHGENGWLFDLNRPREFHDAVDATLSDSGWRERLAAAGHQLAANEFGVAVVAGKVKRLYEELIEEKSGGASLPPSRY